MHVGRLVEALLSLRCRCLSWSNVESGIRMPAARAGDSE